MKWKKLVQAGYRLPLFNTLMLDGLSNVLKDQIGQGHDNMFLITENGVMTWYVPEEDIKSYNEFTTSTINTNPEFISSVIKKTIRNYDELINFCEGLKFIDLSNKNNKDIIELFTTFCLKYKKAQAMYSFPAFTDKVISKLLIGELKKLNQTADEELQEYVQILGIPLRQSEYKEGHENFLRIVLRVKQNKELARVFDDDIEDIKDNLIRFHPAIDRALDDHVEKFSYIVVHHAFNPPTKEYYLRQIKKELNKDIDEKLKEIENYVSDVEKQKKDILNKLNVNDKIINYIDYLEEIAYVNDVRKLSHSKSHYLSHCLLREIANRLDISHIELKHLTSDEIINTLKHGKADLALIESRMKLNVICTFNKKLLFLEGNKAKDLISKTLPQQKKEITEFKGRIASKGKVQGLVKLIIKEHEINKVEKGDILVTSMTNPDMVLVMERAGAIVTDEGGLLCHAAIVSRELNTPCIVGTEIATEVLKDGDLVEVDAEKGVVKILKRS